MRINYIKALAGVLMFYVIWGLLGSSSIYAGENKVVRVGYEAIEGYEEGLEGERKSGFGYEYLQKISYYTGWDYEYVYGTFSELIEMLKKGEIDLLGDVAYTDERAEHMLFSTYAQGTEGYYIFKKQNNELIKLGNVDTVIIATGSRAYAPLAEQLQCCDCEVICVGDANRAKTGKDNMHEAFQIALHI